MHSPNPPKAVTRGVRRIRAYAAACTVLVALAACGRGPFQGDAVLDSSGRTVLGRTPADLLPVEERPTCAEFGLVRIAPITAEIAGRNIVGWSRSDGYSSDPWAGSVLQVWAEGAYVRLDRKDRDKYTVGVLDARRLEVLVDELRETGILEHAKFDYCVFHGQTEDLRIRTPEGEHSFAIWPSRAGRGRDGLMKQLPWTECMRALEVLRRVRSDVEDPLAAHERDGVFAAFSQRKGQLPR